MIYDLTADVDPEDPRTLAEALLGSRQGLAQSFSPVFCFSVVEQNIVLILLCVFVLLLLLLLLQNLVTVLCRRDFIG